MRKQLQYTVSLLLFAVLIAASCKKDKDNNTNTAKTKTELITSGAWKRTALTSNPAYDWNANGVFDTNILNTMFSCEKDNFDTYKTNGIMETNEGASKCNPSDPQTWTATWTWTNNETKIIFDNYDEYILDELTATTLKLRQTFVENGVTYTHYETYGH